MIVCIVCDVSKKPNALAALPGSNRDVSWCESCERETSSRSVARDSENIAPGSCITFAEQRKLWVLSKHG